MNKKVFAIGGALFCATLVLILLYGAERKEWTYDVVVLGDSIFGNVQDETSVPAVMEKELEFSVFNGGLGGTTASCVTEMNAEDVIVNSPSFFYLANAIATNNFSVVLSAQPVKDDGDLWYFENTVNLISRIDFSKTKILVIEHGLNDYFCQRTVTGDVEDVTTFIGALRSGIKMLQDAYPEMEIVLVTPVYYEEEALGIPLSMYVEAELALAKELGILCYNAYGEQLVNAENVSELTIDGVHLNEEGRRIFGEKIAGFIEANLLVDR